MGAFVIQRSGSPLETLRILRRVVRNPLEAWPRAVYSEPLVRTRFLGQTTLFVTDPDCVQQVLVDQADSFVKAEQMRRALEPALGPAILTSEGARWRMQRRIASPVFRPSHVNGFIPAMLEAARAKRDRWAALPRGFELEMTHEMMDVTFDIILQTMLSGRGGADVARVERAMRDMLETTSWTLALSALQAPLWTPFPGKYRGARASVYLHGMVRDRVVERRRTGERRDDLLSLMLDAADPETGAGMDEADIADNVLTFVAAGHETTALALTWTFYLLARHPEIEQRVLDEIAAVTGGAAIEPGQVSQLPYTRMVIQESMRLYPPAPLVVRQPTRDIVIGGERMTPDDTVIVPIHAVQRHEMLWRAPEVFDPERFAPEAVRARHRYAYLPFGAGPRICIGMGFALLEAQAILATLLPTVHLSVAKDFIPTPRLRVTMRPAEGMPLRAFERRKTNATS
jgi:cytochrome P450